MIDRSGRSAVRASVIVRDAMYCARSRAILTPRPFLRRAPNCTVRHYCVANMRRAKCRFLLVIIPARRDATLAG